MSHFGGLNIFILSTHLNMIYNRETRIFNPCNKEELPEQDILDCKQVDGDSDAGTDKPDNVLAAEEGSQRASLVVVVDGHYKEWDKWFLGSRKSCDDERQQVQDEPMEGQDDGDVQQNGMNENFV
jgi:hypothetical protein